MRNWKVTATENGVMLDLFIDAVSEGEARVIAEAHYPDALIVEVREAYEDGSIQSIK